MTPHSLATQFADFGFARNLPKTTLVKHCSGSEGSGSCGVICFPVAFISTHTHAFKVKVL